MKYWIAALAMAGVAMPAQAKWYEASSEHFVIYADDSEKDIQRFATNLEQFHSAIEYVQQYDMPTPSPSNRVVIFVAGNQKDIRELAGADSKYLGGFYIPRAGASRAFVQDIRNTSGYPSYSTTILLHEYAHHFLISSSRLALPRWLSEGAAEFFASAGFNRDGSVQIGRPARHRAGELAYADDVTVHELLDYDLYKKNRSKRYDAFYGRSWALFHYLRFNKERQGQLSTYLRLISNGEDAVAAGPKAFGDLDVLEKELDAYLKQRRMYGYDLKPELISYGPITLRELSEGEAEMMPICMRSQRGVNREEAEELVVEAREVASKFPDDPAVLTALAEAEYDAGNNDAAVAAADRALAIDPHQKNAYVQKGYALFSKAVDAGPEEEEAAFKEAQKPFTALNRLENDHPIPLIYYYRSFISQGKEPTDTARHALERASELAPFDQGLGMSTGSMLAKEGKIAFAINTLRPIASNPHGGQLATLAQRYITAMEGAEEGKPFSLKGSLVRAVVDLDEESEEPESPEEE